MLKPKVVPGDLASVEPPQFAGLVTLLYDTLAGAYSQMYQMQWLPQKFWTYGGGDWTVAVGQGVWVFVETSKVDFDALCRAFGACR